MHLKGGGRIEAGKNPLRDLIESDFAEMAKTEGGKLMEAWEGAQEAETIWTGEWLREFSKANIEMIWEVKEDEEREQLKEEEK